MVKDNRCTGAGNGRYSLLSFFEEVIRGILPLQYRYSVLQGTIPPLSYPPISLFGFAGYDSDAFLPSNIVIRFCRVRFRRFLTLPYRYSVLQGTIPTLSYPPIPLFGLAGYDSDAFLPSHIVIRFCRVRFRRFLTLPYRYSVLQGTIPTIPYPPISLFGLAGYDSSRFLTLPYRYSVLQGTIPTLSYPPIPLFGFAGYGSDAFLPSHIVIRFCRAFPLANEA